MRGRSYWKVGAFDSALQWFERLDMWEDMVQCHILGTKKGERERAIVIVRKRLDCLRVTERESKEEREREL
jgi:hypothetical protein